MTTDMKFKRRIGLPMTSWVSEDGRIYMAIEDRGEYLTTESGATEARAKKALQKRLVNIVRAEELRERNFMRHLIACKDGTILLVEFRNGWQYRITREGSKSASACMFGEDSKLEQVVEAAHRHADQSYGGVAWESYI